MNEKIKEFAFECARELDWDPPTEPKTYTFTEAGIEKFAELIVAECCSKLAEMGDGWHEFAQNGFDWESGRFILTPEENLTPSDRDFAEQMREMQDKLGWAEYENRGLKAEIRRLKKQLGEQNE